MPGLKNKRGHGVRGDVVFLGEKLVVSQPDSGPMKTAILNDDRLFGGREVGANELCVFLGLDQNGHAVFARRLGAGEEQTLLSHHESARLSAMDLRGLGSQGLLPRRELGLLAQAHSLLNGHVTHGFCAACGHKTAIRDAGYRRICPACGRNHFPRTDPVVIMAGASWRSVSSWSQKAVCSGSLFRSCRFRRARRDNRGCVPTRIA